MATTRRSKSSKKAEGSKIETYRGHTIQVIPAVAVKMKSADSPDTPAVESGKVLIDGREISYEQTEDGVHSHEFMFQKFATPFELAEELIKQWGTAQPKSNSENPEHPHHSG